MSAHIRTALTLALVASIVAAGCAAPEPTGEDSVVRTDLGLVRGTVHDEVRSFQNLPYAAAPKGALRWRAPQPAAPWQGVRDATRPGDICPQAPGARPGRQSEDCLNLKVTTATSPEHPRPVLVLLDAGALTVSSNVGTDPHRMATKGEVVVVQPNERMNLFGFFAHPKLRDPAAGSFGIQDQQAALRWVQRNIAAFGGDPGNVTLAGISGGGISTCANVASPGAKGLFQRAIIQSGPCDGQLSPFVPGQPELDFAQSLRQVRARGAKLAADLGCDTAKDVLGCLRGKPFRAFKDHIGQFGATAYGNAVLPIAPADALRTGRFNRVPILTGTTRDEIAFYVNSAFAKGIDQATYRRLLDDGSGNADAIAARYPPRRYGGSPAAALNAAFTDRYFALRARQDQRALSAHVPVFSYEFADRFAPLDRGLGVPLPPRQDVSIPYGAYHGSEIQYLYDTVGYRPPFTREQSTLASQMLRYWASFIHHGNPGVDGQRAWPAFDNTDRVPHVQRLSTTGQGGIGAVRDYAAEHHFDFWNRLYPTG